MQALRVALVQGATRWHDPAGNRDYYGALMTPLKGSDLIVLPETFTSGFSNEAIHTAETMDGPTVAWLREQAHALDAAVTGSVQLRVEGKVYNRLLFVTPDGKIQHYDKRHLFRYAGEHERYATGNERLIVEWRGWRVARWSVTPCVSGIFAQSAHPGWVRLRLTAVRRNWPTPRRDPWRTLLRAIENLCYCAGLNRVGTGNGQLFRRARCSFPRRAARRARLA